MAPDIIERWKASV